MTQHMECPLSDEDLLSQSRTLKIAALLWRLYAKDKAFKIQMVAIEARIDTGRYLIGDAVGLHTYWLLTAYLLWSAPQVLMEHQSVRRSTSLKEASCDSRDMAQIWVCPIGACSQDVLQQESRPSLNIVPPFIHFC